MRYTLAILALSLGLSAVMPAAFASERDGQDLSVARASTNSRLVYPGYCNSGGHR